MTWVLLTLVAVTSRALFGLIGKVLATRLGVSAVTQTVVLLGTSSVLILITNPVLGGLSYTGLVDHWPLAIVMVSTFAVGNILYFRGLAHLDVGTTQIAFSTLVLWGSVLSVVFLNTRFSLLQVIGLCLLPIGIRIVQNGGEQANNTWAIAQIVSSAALFAVSQVAGADLARHTTAATYSLMLYGGATLMLFLIFPLTIRRDISGLRSQALAPLLTAAGATAFFAVAYADGIYFAYRAAPDRGIVVVLMATQAVLAVVLAAIFLRERKDLARKLLASCLTIAATILLAFH